MFACMEVLTKSRQLSSGMAQCIKQDAFGRSFIFVYLHKAVRISGAGILQPLVLEWFWDSFAMIVQISYFMGGFGYILVFNVTFL